MKRNVAILVLGFLFGGIFAIAVVDPATKVNLAQGVILRQYLLVYCTHSQSGLSDADTIFVSGEAAAMSRTIIAAGLGPLGLVEYAKCKSGVH